MRTVADKGCCHEPEYSDGNCHDRRGRPSELVDEPAERARTGELAQITRLLNKPDRDGDGFGCGRVPRSRSINRRRGEPADSEDDYAHPRG